ncbi:MAG: TauD/TfdA family dioxygenase [Gammaproteobacteria bacterium]|nr:TauD/TfdA family dioxygenase [Gammaproteobacteria bacterium]
MESEYRYIRVTPVSPALGAEIGNVDIAAGVSDEQFAEIRQAFIEYGVIFLRDQEITPEQHIGFAERWGQININRFFRPVASHPQIAEVRKEPHQKNNIGAQWHTDHSYDQVPALGSILYAREVPRVGGDTLFASMYAAYDALSDGMQRMLLGLQAEHSSRHSFGEEAYVGIDDDELGGRLGNVEAATQDALHPVVIKHPLSGRPALYVNPEFTLRFAGWTDAESRPLLEYLYQHARQNEFTCRFHWQPGSMAIWDNRATQHCALNDYHGQRRLMHRITLDGVPLEAAAA